MYAHVNTYRLSTSDEVERELAAFDESGITISDQCARTLASWYHSPSPADENLTRLSHGLPFDTDDLQYEVERDMEFRESEAMGDWIATLEAVLSDVPEPITYADSTHDPYSEHY